MYIEYGRDVLFVKNLIQCIIYHLINFYMHGYCFQIMMLVHSNVLITDLVRNDVAWKIDHNKKLIGHVFVENTKFSCNNTSTKNLSTEKLKR